LPQIAGQVQDQVADAVERGVRAPPNLFVVQLSLAMLDFGQGRGQFGGGLGADGASQFVSGHGKL